MANEGVKQVGGQVPPEHRRCGYLRVSGAPCKSFTRVGGKCCSRHQAWNETDPLYPIKVPLLEDPDSIRFVVSQTVRALAMGTLPSANGRAMLAGCRMAMGLLEHELAVEKLRAKSRGQGQPEIQVAGDRLQVAGGGLQVAGGGGESGSSESHTCQQRAEPFGSAPAVLRSGQGMGHPENQVTGDGSGVIGGGGGSVSSVESTDGPHLARRQDLPFDPACPPAWDQATMKDWPKEHLAAWFQAVAPTAAQREVRDFVRGMWDVPQADEKAGWPGRREGAAAREDCIFRAMTAEEIAGWVKKEIPDMPAGEAKEYAEERAGIGAIGAGGR
jgi:hypothetical protein